MGKAIPSTRQSHEGTSEALDQNGVREYGRRSEAMPGLLRRCQVWSFPIVSTLSARRTSKSEHRYFRLRLYLSELVAEI